MKKIRLFALAIAAGIGMAAGAAATSGIQFYRSLSENLGIVQMYDTSNLTVDILTHRDGNIIIERIIGVCIDDAGNGQVLCENPELGSYISYKGIAASKGDVVLTYCLYNPDSNDTDDILERFDYIIDQGQ